MHRLHGKRYMYRNTIPTAWVSDYAIHAREDYSGEQSDACEIRVSS